VRSARRDVQAPCPNADNFVDMADDFSLLDQLPDPVLLVLPTGATQFGNRAWRELVAGLGAGTELASAFGPQVLAVLDEARRSGRASTFLPFVLGGGQRGCRVTALAGARGGTLAVQLTDLSQEVAWRHQLFLRNSELTVLNDVGTALSGTLEFEALARRIWEQTGRIMDNAHFFLALAADPQHPAQLLLWIEGGQPAPSADAGEFALALARHVQAAGGPLLANGDVAAELAAAGLPAPRRAYASLLAMPILADGEPLGALALMDESQPERYGRHEQGVLAIVAMQAATAIRTVRMFQAMRAAYEELSGAQSRLLESERLRGVTETVGALNHEVNNPLATIVGTAQLLLRGAGLPQETRPRIERMLEAAKRIQFVTNRMATLIQATSRPYPGQTQILDLSRSLARAEHDPVRRSESVSQIIRIIREQVPGRPPAAPESDAA